MISIMAFLPNLWEFIGLLLTMIFSFIFGYVAVYNPKYRFSQIEALNIPPFSCIKCMTVQTNLIVNIIFAYLFDPYYLIWGVITSIMVRYAIKLGYEY